MVKLCLTVVINICENADCLAGNLVVHTVTTGLSDFGIPISFALRL